MQHASGETLGAAKPEDHGGADGNGAGPPAPVDPAEELRGELFMGLDRLAFALELEAAEAVEEGREEKAVNLESQRLGVRLAQRFVAGVYADEVDPRIARTRAAYDSRTGASSES